MSRQTDRYRAMFSVRMGAGTPPVVFVHGFGCSHEDWVHQLTGLSSRATTVAVDLRGHGRTPGTVDECNIGTYGSDIVHAVSTIGQGPAVLVGHSLGCRAVLEAARISAAAVAGVVLVEGSRYGGPGSGADEALASQIADAGYDAFLRGFVAGMFLESSDRALVQRVTERALALPADAGRSLLVDAVRWDMNRFDEAMSRLEVPVLALQSTYVDADRKHIPLRAGETTPYLDLLRARLADCSIVVLPGKGHFLPVVAPDEVTSHIRPFVGGIGTRRSPSFSDWPGRG